MIRRLGQYISHQNRQITQAGDTHDRISGLHFTLWLCWKSKGGGMGAARRVVRAGRAAVGAERSPSARGWHAVVEQVDRALAEQALVGDSRARLHDAAAHPARVRVARCGRRADDDHRRSQDDFSEAGVDFAAVALVEVLVVDELLHRRRPIEAGEEGRVCVRVDTCSLAVDVSRTRRRQGSVGGLGVPPGIARRARRRRQTPKRIWTPTSSGTRMLSGQVVGRRERRLLLCGCSGEPRRLRAMVSARRGRVDYVCRAPPQ